MKVKPVLQFVLAILILAAAGVTPSAAAEFKLGDLTIDHPWARPSLGNAPNGAAYMTLKNAGPKADLLESVSSPVAGKAELHTHIKEGDIMKMRRVEGGVAVPANGEAKFAPGGLHIMLIGLKERLAEGESFPVTLKFRDAGEVTVDVKVEKPKANAAGGPKHHH